MTRPLYRLAQAAALAAFFVSGAALSQGNVVQGGPWTPGHIPAYPQQQSGQAIVVDGGPAGGGGVGVGVGEIGMQVRGIGLPPFANAGTGPNGENFCDYDGPLTSANGYHYLCISPNALGGGLISYGAVGLATPLPLQFFINGALSTPGIGDVVGPNSSTIGFVPAWGNITGTLLTAGLPTGSTGVSVLLQTDGTGHIDGSVIPTTLPSGLTIPSPTITGAPVFPNASIPNAALINSSTTVNGQSCVLGASCTVMAAATSITNNSTTISGGAANNVLTDNGGTLTETATSGTGSIARVTSPVFVTPALGTPSSVTLTNATGLPIAGITGLGTGVGAALAAAATGSGGIVLATSPTLTTPVLGVSTGTSLALGGCTITGFVLCTTGNASIGGNLAVSGSISGGGITALFSSPPPIGNVAANTGAFTTLSASSTVSGAGFSAYLASPPAIGGTTPNNGNFSGLGIGTSTQESGGLVVASQLSAIVPSSLAQQYTSGTAQVITYGATSTTYSPYQIVQQHSDGSGGRSVLLTDSSGNSLFGAGTLSVSSGLANSLVLSGSNTDASITGSTGLTIGAASGDITLAPSASIVFQNVPFPTYIMSSTNSLGTDLKNWGWSLDGGGNMYFAAFNDAVSNHTPAWAIGRGTTFNILNQVWSTSTTAGTPVQGMSLTPTVFTVGDGTHTSFSVVSPGANNWVNSIQAIGSTSGNTPFISGAGTTNANLGLSSSGSGTVFLTTEGGGKVQFAVIDNASGADYPTATSGASSGLISSNAGNMTYSAVGNVILLPGSGSSLVLQGNNALNALAIGSGGPNFATVAGGAATVTYGTNAGNVSFGSTGGTTTLSDANVVVSALSATAGPVWNTTGKALTSTAASQTAHFVYAAPTTTGAPTFRLLVASDLPASVVPLSGTSASLGGSALLAGQCSTNTTTITGATTSMVALADPVTDPGTGAYWDAFVSSSNTVTTKVCATIALTPTASAYNIRVLQ